MSAPAAVPQFCRGSLCRNRAVEDTRSIAQANRLIRPPSGGSSRYFTSPTRGSAKWPIAGDGESQRIVGGRSPHPPKAAAEFSLRPLRVAAGSELRGEQLPVPFGDDLDGAVDD